MGSSRKTLVAVALFAVALVIGVGGILALTKRDDGPGTVTIHLGVDMLMSDQTMSFNEGSTCKIARDVGQQVVVSNDQGTIIGQITPDNGTYRLAGNGDWFCSHNEDLEVEDSMLYTFTVNKQYGEVIDHQTLEATDWNHTLDWPAT